MNLSHFHRQPLFTVFRGLEVPGHELYTQLSPVTAPGIEHACILCRCGWYFQRPLWELYDGRDAYFQSFAEAACEHLRAQSRPPSLAELTDWGWFDPDGGGAP